MAKRGLAVHVVTTRRKYKGKVYETYLLRRSYREGGKVKKETLANLSHLPKDIVDIIARSLRGEHFISADDALRIKRTLPHGHIAAVLGTIRSMGLEKTLQSKRSRMRDLITALICQQVVDPGSKLSSVRRFKKTTLGKILKVEDATEAEILKAMDWLLGRQGKIQKALVKRYLQPGSFVLYDLSSSYVEGKKCPLAEFGYSRDKKRGKRQINYGLVCTPKGRPVSIEVFSGSVKDSQTVIQSIKKVVEDFGIKQVVLVGDRGMIVKGNIEKLKDLKIDWITALKSRQIQSLAKGGAIQLSLFDQINLAEIQHQDYPNERLIVCRNPLVAKERARKREELLQSTEAELNKVKQMTQHGRFKNKSAADIAVRVGKVVNRFKVAKHFVLDIKDGFFDFKRDQSSIERQAALDGIYCLRTSLEKQRLDAPGVVRAYKQLSKVEQAFRCLKAPDLEIRPIFHYLEDRVRAHIFLCMLAYLVQFELKERLGELLFKDEDSRLNPDPVAKAECSNKAKRKAGTKRTNSGFEAHSFCDLLQELSMLSESLVCIEGTDGCFYQLTQSTPLQARAFELLGFSPNSL